MSNIFIVVFCVLNAVGLILWCWVSLIFLEITLCKDAKHVTMSKLFSRRLSFRLRLFLRSWQKAFYRGSVLIWLGSYVAIFIRLSEFSSGVIPLTNFPRALSAILIPMGIVLVCKSLGYESNLFTDKHKVH